MAPDTVVNKISSNYLTAINWLHNSVLNDRARQWAMAPVYLDGEFLKRYQRLLVRYQTGSSPRAQGVLRADHQVMVRHFSEDGESCLVVDSQTQRRMATYDRQTGQRVHTQDLGDCTQVYQMVYDAASRRWKIRAFIQELPAGWNTLSMSRHVRVLSTLPTMTGRDN
jgi:hypothetical protein